MNVSWQTSFSSSALDIFSRITPDVLIMDFTIGNSRKIRHLIIAVFFKPVIKTDILFACFTKGRGGGTIFSVLRALEGFNLIPIQSLRNT